MNETDRRFQLTNKAETYKHYIAKCICYKMLRDLGRKVSMEKETATGGFLDVFDHDNKLGYEFENNPTQTKVLKKTKLYTRDVAVIDVIFIDLRRLPFEIEGMKKIIDRRIA